MATKKVHSEHPEVHDAPPHHHAVHVYADDLAIGDELIRFVENGLILGESVVVVANREHRAALAAWRSGHPSICDGEYLVMLDAEKTLQTLVVAGMPDEALFGSTARGIVDSAASGGRSVRVYGEMVAMLWNQGNVAGALTLESLWNELAMTRSFFLMCGYPESALAHAPLTDVNAMCVLHSDISMIGYQMPFAAASTATQPRYERLLIPAHTATGSARHFAVRTLVDWELPQLIESCAIIASELAANAVEHAESAFRLTLSREIASLRIAVEDAAPNRRAVKPKPDWVDRSGLAKVVSLASNWGCDITPDGKTVWAELAL